MRGVLCRELVGRDDDLDQARVILGQARSGAGALACVLGEAGVGKSRLAREAVALARVQGLHVLFGRAVRAETPVPFRPLAEALLSHFRHHGPPAAAELAPFRAVLGRLHIHVKVSQPGFRPLTTQIYFEGDPWLDFDAVGAVKATLVTALARHEGHGRPYATSSYDFVLSSA